MTVHLTSSPDSQITSARDFIISPHSPSFPPPFFFFFFYSILLHLFSPSSSLLIYSSLNFHSLLLFPPLNYPLTASVLASCFAEIGLDLDPELIPSFSESLYLSRNIPLSLFSLFLRFLLLQGEENEKYEAIQTYTAPLNE